MPGPEFSRPLAIERIGHGLDFSVQAQPEECAALAARMGLEGVLSLDCRFALKRIRIRGGEVSAVQAQGMLRARVVQVCVVSLDPFEVPVEEDFSVRFVPAGSEREDVDLEDEDEIPYEGSMIDLGEAAAEQLALALDPFPRKPGAALDPAAQDDPAGPFAALRLLRPQ